MSNNDRFLRIIDYLKTHNSATVEELAKMLYVSIATIRRDLTELQKRGQVKRSHGGAILAEGTDEISIFIRQIKNANEKDIAISVALKHMPDYQTVFIDNSSTCLALAERMNLTHKTVVTNGLQVAMNISRKNNVNLIMPGGEVRFNTAAVLGSMAASNLNRFNFDLSITSCAAVDKDGTYELTLETTEIKKIAIERSKKRVLLFDNTKANTLATYRTATLKSYDFIFTNADAASINMLDPDKACNILNN